MALQALAGNTCKTTTKRVTKPTKASMGKIEKLDTLIYKYIYK